MNVPKFLLKLFYSLAPSVVLGFIAQMLADSYLNVLNNTNGVVLASDVIELQYAGLTVGILVFIIVYRMLSKK